MSSLGEAFFDVLADTSGFGASLEEGITEAVSGAETAVAGAMGGISDEVESSLGSAGSSGGDALADGIEGSIDGIEVGDGVFDSVVGDAEEAASGVSAAFDGVGAEIEESLSGAFDGVAGSLGSLQGALGTAAGGAGLEGLARGQQDLTLSAERLANMTGISTGGIRDLATSLSNATFPLGDVTELLELASQRGLEGQDAISDYATFWDKVGDATGSSGPKLAAAAVGLEALGIGAADGEQAMDAFGFITESTVGTVDEFLQFVERTGPELRELGLGVDETAGLLGAMESELGLTGRVARTEFREAVNSADGDLRKMLETLGLSEDQLAEYTDKVAGSSSVIDANADAFAAVRTPMEKVQSALSDLAFRFDGVGQAAGLLAAPLGAMGPVMLGLNQGSQFLAGGLGGKLVKGIKGAASAFKTLSVAILTNPIFLIAALIIGIIAVIWIFRDEIIAGLGAAWDWIKDTAGAVWGWLSDTVSNAVDWVIGFVAGLRDRIVEFFQAMWDFVIEYHPLAIAFRLVKEFVPKIVAWIRDLVDRVVDRFTSLVDTVRSLVSGFVDRITGFASTLRDNFVDNMRRLVTDPIQFFRDLPGNIIRALGSVGDILLDVGRSIIRGLLNGLRNAWGTITGWVSDTIGGLGRFAGRLLGISSPSKMFEDIGKDVMAGFAVGLSDQDGVIAMMDRAVDNLSGRTIGGIDVTGTAGMPAGTRLAAGAVPVGGRRIEVNISNPLPEPASVSVARQMRKLQAIGVFDD